MESDRCFPSIRERRSLYENKKAGRTDQSSARESCRERLAGLSDSGRGATSTRERRQIFESRDTPQKTESHRADLAEFFDSGGHGATSTRERRQMFEGRKVLQNEENFSEAGLVTLAVIEDDHFSVNYKSLESFLKRNELKGRPLVILSIAGVFRSGKSFIMNFYIRYLREKGWMNPDWFGDGDDKISDGFEWRRGSVACTKGIHVWSEIFDVPLRDGRKAAVLLVDTQGLFDGDTSPDTNAKIMSISTLFCSHQILNLSKLIEERDLEHLQLCVAMAKAAMSTGSGHTKPFQTLTFLIRDWEFEFEHEYGDSTYGYLQKYFGKQSASEEIQKVKDSIPAAFNDVKCFLLPHPGRKVTKSDGLNLRNKDIDEDFQECAKQLVEKLLHPRNLVVKRTREGEEATADDVVRMISLVGKSFASGVIPKAKTLLQYMAGTNNTKALNEAFAAYKIRLHELCQSNDSRNTFKENHERALKLAEVQFRYMANIGDETSKVEFLIQLKTKCEEEFEDFRDFGGGAQIVDEPDIQSELPDFVKNYRKIDSNLTLVSPTDIGSRGVFFGPICKSRTEKNKIAYTRKEEDSSSTDEDGTSPYVYK